MARAATETQRAGLGGRGFGLATPGTVGGAVWANAGAHGDDVAGVIASATVLGPDGSERVVGPAEPALSYPHTPFKHVARPPGPGGGPPPPRPRALPSAGSVFRNPSPEISAGELIDAAGLKGRRVGGAVVSAKHANFIVNDAGGTADDVRRLAELVRAGGAPAPGVEPVFPGC